MLLRILGAAGATPSNKGQSKEQQKSPSQVSGGLGELHTSSFLLHRPNFLGLGRAFWNLHNAGEMTEAFVLLVLGVFLVVGLKESDST